MQSQVVTSQCRPKLGETPVRVYDVADLELPLGAKHAHGRAWCPAHGRAEPRLICKAHPSLLLLFSHVSQRRAKLGSTSSNSPQPSTPGLRVLQIQRASGSARPGSSPKPGSSSIVHATLSRFSRGRCLHTYLGVSGRIATQGELSSVCRAVVSDAIQGVLGSAF